MDFDSVYQEQAQIAKAWVEFVSKGTLPQNVRPIIAKSWIRCQGNGLNAWESPYLEMRRTTGELSQKLKERKWMLEACIAIMQYLSGFLDEICLKLKDPEGYVLYVQDSVDSSKLYLHGVGLILNENRQGTIASALAIRHQTYVDTNGFEHFFVCYHKFFRSAFPIWSRAGEIGGALELFTNYYSNDTKIARECMQRAAGIIKNFISGGGHPFEKTKEFSEILDLAKDAICCMDYNCKILNVNQKLLEEWNIEQRHDVTGASIHNFVSIKNFNLLKMYPGRVRIMDAVHGGSGKSGSVSVSTIYRPGATEVFLLRFHKATFRTQEKAWADYEKITILDQGVEYDTYDMIGDSSEMKTIRKVIGKIAPTSATVLIEGATGTGKEVVARAIHKRSGVNGAFIAVNCGAIPADLLQSELFGYVCGAFSGADKKGRVGKLEAADGGTIFLDEIGEMPPDMQVSLLRFLQDYRITRLGSNASVKVSTRVIAATNRNLQHEVHVGNFREDLYYRLNVVKINVPALSDRKEDIIAIAQYYLEVFAAQFHHKNLGCFDQETSYLLCNYSWPGNIRELKNVVERVVLFAEADAVYVTKEMLPAELKEQPRTRDGAAAALRLGDDGAGKNIAQRETELIIGALEQCDGNVAQAAALLGIHRATLYRKMKKLRGG